MAIFVSCIVNSVDQIWRLLSSFIVEHKRIVIVGLGNRYRTDDGAGLSVIDSLRAAGIDKIDDIIIVTAEDNFLSHVSEVEQSMPSGLLLIDSANIGTEPGNIMLLNQDQIVEGHISTHEANLGLGLAYLKSVIPRLRVMLLGIQYDSLEVSDEPKLTRKLGVAVRKVADVIIGAAHGRVK